MNLTEVKQAISEAVAYVEKRGWTITTKVTLRTEDMCCCILGAVCIAKGESYCNVSAALASDILGIKPFQSNLIIAGFDDCSIVKNESEWYDLGASFRDIAQMGD